MSLVFTWRPFKTTAKQQDLQRELRQTANTNDLAWLDFWPALEGILARSASRICLPACIILKLLTK